MRHDHSLRALCERESVLVSPSGFYAWLNRQSNPGPRALESLALAKDIKVLHAQSRQTYGSPRIQEALLKEGRRHGRNRIAPTRWGLGLNRQSRATIALITPVSGFSQLGNSSGT